MPLNRNQNPKSDNCKWLPKGVHMHYFLSFFLTFLQILDYVERRCRLWFSLLPSPPLFLSPSVFLSTPLILWEPIVGAFNLKTPPSFRHRPAVCSSRQCPVVKSISPRVWPQMPEEVACFVHAGGKIEN